MELEIRHLRLVCVVAEAGSITKAAATLGIAQPALTAQLQRIERVLGGALFERDHTGIRPTPLGEFVLARSRLLLPAVSSLREEAGRFGGSLEHGEVPAQLTIGSATGPILGRLVHHVTTTYPAANVTTQVSWSASELADQVAEGRVDYLLVGTCGDAQPPARSGLMWCELGLDPVFVLLAADHPLASHPTIELVELAGTAWGATPGEGCFASCFAAACARAGFTPKVLYETDVIACLDMAQSGEVAVLCQPMIREMPGVVARPLAGTPLTWRHLIGWHPASRTAPLSGRLTSLARTAYQEIVADSTRYTSWLTANPSYGPLEDLSLRQRAR